MRLSGQGCRRGGMWPQDAVRAERLAAAAARLWDGRRKQPDRGCRGRIAARGRGRNSLFALRRDKSRKEGSVAPHHAPPPMLAVKPAHHPPWRLTRPGDCAKGASCAGFIWRPRKLRQVEWTGRGRMPQYHRAPLGACLPPSDGRASPECWLERPQPGSRCPLRRLQPPAAATGTAILQPHALRGHLCLALIFQVFHVRDITPFTFLQIPADSTASITSTFFPSVERLPRLARPRPPTAALITRFPTTPPLAACHSQRHVSSETACCAPWRSRRAPAVERNHQGGEQSRPVEQRGWASARGAECLLAEGASSELGAAATGAVQRPPSFAGSSRWHSVRVEPAALECCRSPT